MGVGHQRAGAACGVAGPLAFLVLYVVAMAGDPGYTFFEDYLSDLGVGPAAWAFNSAVVVAGALTFPFILLGLRPRLDGGVVSTVGALMALAGAGFLILVGIFPGDRVPAHEIVTVGFFVSMLASLGLFSWTFHLSGSLGRLATHVTESAFVIGLVLMAFGFNPQTETVAVLDIVVWAMFVAVTLLREGGGEAPTT